VIEDGISLFALFCEGGQQSLCPLWWQLHRVARTVKNKVKIKKMSDVCQTPPIQPLGQSRFSPIVTRVLCFGHG
jgi:hypothetical protein